MREDERLDREGAKPFRVLRGGSQLDGDADDRLPIADGNRPKANGYRPTAFLLPRYAHQDDDLGGIGLDGVRLAHRAGELGGHHRAP